MGRPGRRRKESRLKTKERKPFRFPLQQTGGLIERNAESVSSCRGGNTRELSHRYANLRLERRSGDCRMSRCGRKQSALLYSHQGGADKDATRIVVLPWRGGPGSLPAC
jgi:hypothetical protein